MTYPKKSNNAGSAATCLSASGRRSLSRMLCLGGSLLLGSSLPMHGEPGVSDAKDVLQRYVDTRQAISRELNAWTEQKEILIQTVELLRKEMELLESRAEEFEGAASEAERERARLDEENQVLVEISDRIRARIIPLEKRARELAKAFPAPLRKNLEPVLARLPRDPEESEAALGSRLQNLVAVLTEADRFNGRITLESEVRETSDGPVEVRTLYMGLGGAFFVDSGARVAGIGKPGEDGWVWEEQNQIAEQVRLAVSMYENERQADFVRLPLTWN